MPYIAILVALLAPLFVIDDARFASSASAAASGMQLAYEDNLYRGDIDDDDDDDDGSADDGDDFDDDDDDDDSAHGPDTDGGGTEEIRSVSA